MTSGTATTVKRNEALTAVICKPRSIVVVAVARELAGHCWALATME
jgi:hypothetical protein